VSGSAFGYRPLVGALAAAAGATVLVPEYRLAPEHPFPAAIDDALRAYRWMADRSDPAGLTLVGDSIGAHLVLSLLLTLKQQQMPMPGGAALLCPGVDLSMAEVLRNLGLAGAGMRSWIELARQYGDAYLAGHPGDDPVVDPLHADLSGLPRLLIQAGTGDYLLSDARRLAEHARAHDVDVRLELYPAVTHVFHVFWSFLPEAADALAEAGRFAQETLRDGVARPGAADAGGGTEAAGAGTASA
jgi:acetyl esterase/lipase